jgi:heptosyltransferase-2
MKDRIILLLVQMLGFIMSKLPYSVLEKMTEFIGRVLITIPNSRRRLLLSNFRHVFPDWSHEKILSVAKESAARMFEMGFFSLSYPFMTKEQCRHTVFYDKAADAKLEELRKTGRPVLFLVPHTCLFESLATSPLFRPLGMRSLGAIYRPNKNHALDEWITKGREKVGVKTFSRKEGIIRARAHLKAGNWLVLLYDQNAGMRGNGSSFLGRICSISPLPDLLAKNKDVICVHATAKRGSFFRSRLELKDIAGNGKSICETAHDHLAQEISRLSNGFPEWLWGHGKWKVNDMNFEFFGLQEKFISGLSGIVSDKTNRLLIRMPNWLGDIVMAIPIIRAVRTGRPDMHISILCKPIYSEWLNSLGVADEICGLDTRKGTGYYFQFLNFRKMYPDGYLNLANSLRSDIEAVIIGATKRFGMQIRQRRPLLNAKYTPATFSESHQTKVWCQMLDHFGFNKQFDFSPQYPPPISQVCKKEKIIIGIAPGSQNSPAKRLPATIWVKICRGILLNYANRDLSIELLGTQNDLKICNEIEQSLIDACIINVAGKTSILELQNRMPGSDLLLCNDSGAMHLANMIGVPVLAIFSVTNPEITGPIFDSTNVLLNQNDFEKETDLLNNIRSKVAELVQ